MARKQETVRVRSLQHPKVNGTYHPPGEVWDCPVEHLGPLQELGAVELYAEPPRPKAEESVDKKPSGDAPPAGDQTETGEQTKTGGQE